MLADRHLLLPEEIVVFKIFVTLPVVDVVRCASFCKQWYSLIKTHHFKSANLSFCFKISAFGLLQSPLLHPWMKLLVFPF
uniref:F-box domain-containing protein n=1 Tax=Rhizophora mucronata TaxID=61149 RepID=A0A2P2N5V7_RHIMU